MGNGINTVGVGDASPKDEIVVYVNCDLPGNADTQSCYLVVSWVLSAPVKVL
jgi:hypothetical protein